MTEIKKDTNVKDWFEPDERWKIMGCSTRENYLEKFLVEGRFHKDVPEDIVKDYLTVEYMMAHSYYHYQMYDETAKKLLGIFEIAVKLRCEQLNIPTTYEEKGKLKTRISGL